jgi:hypothetical protein
VGAFALFAGTVVLSILAIWSFVGVSPTAGSTGVLGPGVAALLQSGSTLVDWAQAGWQIRQTVLGFVPPGLIALYAMVSLVAAAFWLRLVMGVQGALQLASR